MRVLFFLAVHNYRLYSTAWSLIELFLGVIMHRIAIQLMVLMIGATAALGQPNWKEVAGPTTDLAPPGDVDGDLLFSPASFTMNSLEMTSSGVVVFAGRDITVRLNGVFYVQPPYNGGVQRKMWDRLDWHPFDEIPDCDYDICAGLVPGKVRVRDQPEGGLFVVGYTGQAAACGTDNRYYEDGYAECLTHIIYPAGPELWDVAWNYVSGDVVYWVEGLDAPQLNVHDGGGYQIMENIPAANVSMCMSSASAIHLLENKLIPWGSSSDAPSATFEGYVSSFCIATKTSGTSFELACFISQIHDVGGDAYDSVLLGNSSGIIGWHKILYVGKEIEPGLFVDQLYRVDVNEEGRVAVSIRTDDNETGIATCVVDSTGEGDCELIVRSGDWTDDLVPRQITEIQEVVVAPTGSIFFSGEADGLTGIWRYDSTSHQIHTVIVEGSGYYFQGSCQEIANVSNIFCANGLDTVLATVSIVGAGTGLVLSNQSNSSIIAMEGSILPGAMSSAGLVQSISSLMSRASGGQDGTARPLSDYNDVVSDLAIDDGLSVDRHLVATEFEFSNCPADIDGSGFLDTDDFDAFIYSFENSLPCADFDHSGFIDTEDFSSFVLAFEAGC